MINIIPKNSFTVIPKNYFNFDSSSHSSTARSSTADPAIFVIFNFVDFSCAVVFF